MSDFNQSKYIQNYKKEKYSRAVIDFKKEEKETIDAFWKKKGIKSFTSYIRYLIEKDMNEEAEAINEKQIDIFLPEELILIELYRRADGRGKRNITRFAKMEIED